MYIGTCNGLNVMRKWCGKINTCKDKIIKIKVKIKRNNKRIRVTKKRKNERNVTPSRYIMQKKMITDEIARDETNDNNDFLAEPRSY